MVRANQKWSFLVLYDRIVDGSAYVAALMMFGMVCCVTYEIISRYFFIQPTSWVTDFTDYIMLYTTLLSCAWLLKHDNHVRLTIVLDRVSDKNTLIMNVVNSLFCVVVCGIIVWFGLADTWDAIQHGIVIPRPVPVPKWLLVGVIPFAFILLVLGFLRSAFRCINQLKTMSGRR